MKRILDQFFLIIAISFSALVLVLSLLASIDLTAEKNKSGQLHREIQELTEHNSVLNKELGQMFRLEVIESFAREELGMQICRPDQLVYLNLPELAE